MAVLSVPAAPRTQADIERLVRAGVRDAKHAAVFLGVSVPQVRRIITSGEVWSFRQGGKRVIPVVELRRYLAASVREAMEENESAPTE